jgi:hypothetical protein
LLLLALLLAGAIVNVAVAWGFSWQFRCVGFSFYDSFDKFDTTPFVVSDELGRRVVIMGYSKITESNFDKPALTYEMPLRQARFGFPCEAMAYDLWWNRGIHIGSGQIKNTYGAQHHTDVVAVPFLPIWPGFAINTIFYAAILWVLFFAPGTIRRTIRRRRGLCPACAYPIGTSPVCTECGVARAVVN